MSYHASAAANCSRHKGSGAHQSSSALVSALNIWRRGADVNRSSVATTLKRRAARVGVICFWWGGNLSEKQESALPGGPALS